MKTKIAKVVVDISLDREFDYLVPARLTDDISVGSRVNVPFGRSRVLGYVVGFTEESTFPQLKEIAGLASPKPFVSESMLKLARWMAEYYCAPVERAIRTVLPGAVRRKGAGFVQKLTASLVESADGEEEVAAALKPLPAKQALVVDFLRENGPTHVAELVRALGITQSPLKTLQKKGVVAIESEDSLRNPSANRTILRTKPLDLMPEQAAALESIARSADTHDPAVVLLYGVTGSGKTEVYLQAIERLLAQGKGSIVLVPEISLTPQTVERFLARFGDRIAVLHSHLSDGERHDEWHRVRDGKADIVIGARSAVFAPVRNLGLIVVDEEHEPSYKQEEAPRYNARDVAVMRARMESCAVVLGSATPSLESWFNAQTGKYALACLPRRADDRRMPSMRVLDMRVEGQRRGKPSILSQDLMTAIQTRLDRAEQTILFLNRRGYATSLVCPQCGFVAGCESCSVSYTYHRHDELLRCHICGASRKVPQACPGCQDPAFKYSGIGTQRIERILEKCFPQARVQRMDADVTTRKDAYDRILGDFRVGKTDILVGTQMIAKGLHFPNVTLVGVVYADLSLHMPDFRAGERTFQLLAQVAGRAGRGDVAGEVLVQTYTPFHPAIQAARRLDFEGLCDQELEFRKELSYPPFSHLVCVTFRGPGEEKVSFCATAFARELRKRVSESVMLSEAVPAPLARAKGQYRYQVMIRSRTVGAMLKHISAVARELKLPRQVTCQVDVDAMSLL